MRFKLVEQDDDGEMKHPELAEVFKVYQIVVKSEKDVLFQLKKLEKEGKFFNSIKKNGIFYSTYLTTIKEDVKEIFKDIKLADIPEIEAMESFVNDIDQEINYWARK